MEDDQQFCLRWNNHQSTLIQNFDTLLESGTLVDCTLAAEGKYLKAHKVVLSACSPYFEGLLSEHYDKHPVFILKDVKFKELKAMMDYMYRGEVNISQDQLAALLKAAESLQIKGLSESKGGNGSTSNKPETRQQKTAPSTTQSSDIPHGSSGLTIEKNNKNNRHNLAQSSVSDLPEDSASPQLPKGLSSREGSQSPTARRRKRLRRRSMNDDNSIDNHEASNSSDMTQHVSGANTNTVDDKSEPVDPLGRSALMQQLTKPTDDMMTIEKPEPTDTLIEPKSEYLDDPEESVEDLTLDDDMNDLNEMEQDNNRAGPSHDPSQHPGLAAWHVSGDRSNASGVVGAAPGANDEVFLAAQEAAQAHRDSQGFFARIGWTGETNRRRNYNNINNNINNNNEDIVPEPLTPQRRARLHCPTRHNNRNNNRQLTISTHEKRHDCSRCGKSYKNAYILRRHILYECGKLPSFNCSQCSFSSKYERNLKAHINHRHVMTKQQPNSTLNQRT
ncbi:longitudinals lacking protein, isoforms A/B/D/L isoform X8 [Aphidius gifuensis]|uniref:longitudinals lacking protein, isoforms A/B/D/L isoform X8 n=1 Tax=Aphidius gifuensis TaxID=684658 RepID=UPI001CDD4B20|nr:longitudinals lacking protein, isoforms A/B/D/L isoform X8 [Aphidius gifuensis]XP_044008754.1 longitudinals lacking protein, isoforms A/B/D/L isoform X8 [Aphidius gifuensis]